MESVVYRALAAGILALHLLWILWVIFGCLLTRGRRKLAWFHVGSLVYSIVIEVGPWWCPLTRFEQWAQRKAGMTPYEQEFLVHYLEEIVYPDIPYTLLAACAVVICVFNLGVYVWRRRKQS